MIFGSVLTQARALCYVIRRRVIGWVWENRSHTDTCTKSPAFNVNRRHSVGCVDYSAAVSWPLSDEPLRKGEIQSLSVVVDASPGLGRLSALYVSYSLVGRATNNAVSTRSTSEEQRRSHTEQEGHIVP